MQEDVWTRAPFLAALTPAERQRLRPHLSVRYVAARQRVWRESERAVEFLFVVRGRAKLARGTASGRDVILDTCGEGELLCASAACAGSDYCCSALALDRPVCVVAVPRNVLLDLLEHNPTAARAFFEHSVRRQQQLAHRIEELSAGHVERRVASLLVRLAAEVGIAGEGQGVWIPVALSRQDIADMCGTTLETAIRTMSRLARERLVLSAERGFVVPNLQRLWQQTPRPASPPDRPEASAEP